jgi:N-acetyl-gamma-glutamyl-phosphate reductase
MDGQAPTEETIAVTAKEGMDVRGFRSRRLTAEMIDDADLVLTMEARHKEYVVDMVKGASGEAVQNMNIMLGLDERTGLEAQAVWP